MDETIYTSELESEVLNEPVIQKRPLTIRLQKYLMILFVVSCSTLVVWSTFKSAKASGTPDTWTLIIHPAKRGSTLQFRQGSSCRYSPCFHIKQEFSDQVYLRLNSTITDVDGIHVENYAKDSQNKTIRLKIGKDTFSIKEDGITANGTAFKWNPVSESASAIKL